MRSFAMNLAASGLLRSASLVAYAAAEVSGLGEMSLAELAEMDTDDIAAISSTLFPAGIYGVRVVSAQLGMRAKKEGIDETTGLPFLPLYYVEWKLEVLEADPLDKEVDPQRLIGRTITDSSTFWPKEFKENIGLVKGAKYKKAGFSIEGKMGGMEGGEPGWLDSAVDQFMIVRVRHGKPNSEGRQNAYFDWMPAPSADSEAA